MKYTLLAFILCCSPAWADWKALVNEGSAALRRGNMVEARRHMLAAQAEIGNLDVNDIEHAVVYQGIASVEQASGRMAEAEGLYAKALAILEADDRPKGPHGATILNNLGAIRMEQSRWSEAEALIDRAAAIFRDCCGDRDPRTADAFSHLAQVQAVQGKLTSAVPMLERSIEIQKAAPAAYVVELPYSLNSLGKVHVIRGDYASALVPLREAYERSRSLGGPHLGLAESAVNLASLYRLLGDSVRAEPLLRVALEASFGSEHLAVASARSNLAQLYVAGGRFDEAEPLIREAIRVEQNAFPQGHPLLAISYHCLAQICERRKRNVEAEQMYLRSIAMHQQFSDRNSPTRAAMADYARFLKSAKRPEAGEWARRARMRN